MLFLTRHASRIKRVVIAMLSEQEAPKWSYELTIKNQILRNETTKALNYQGCQLYYTNHNIYMGRNTYNTRSGGSGVIRPKMSNVPRPPGLLLRCAWVLVVSNINEVVGSIVKVFPVWGSPGLGGISTAGLYTLAGLLDREDTRLKTSSRVQMGLSFAWKTSLAIWILDSFLCNRLCKP